MCLLRWRESFVHNDRNAVWNLHRDSYSKFGQPKPQYGFDGGSTVETSTKNHCCNPSFLLLHSSVFFALRYRSAYRSELAVAYNLVAGWIIVAMSLLGKGSVCAYRDKRLHLLYSFATLFVECWSV